MYFKKEENEKGTIILLHGFGADNKDMHFLAKEWSQLYPQWNFLALNGQINLNPGYGWFDLASNNWVEGMVGAGDYLERYLEEYDKEIIFVGFSQGGFVAAYMGLYSHLNCKACICFSAGVIPIPNIPQPTPIYFIHGAKDEVILPLWYEKSITFGKENNLPINGIMIEEMGHEINDVALNCATKKLNEIILNKNSIN